MRCGGYECKKNEKERDWIPDQVGNDRRRKSSCGVSAPHDEILLFRQKDPKPLAPGRGPTGAFATVPIAWAAELASLRQSSPPTRFRDCGAATPAGAMRWRHGMARLQRQKKEETDSAMRWRGVQRGRAA